MTHLIGRYLVAIDFERERREANFRFALVRIRENSEAVAMMRGEASEREDLLARFSDIVTNWWQLMRREQFLSLFAESYKYYSRYIPYFALSPLFFGGSMQLGAFMQAGSAFNSVHQGFSYFISSYIRIAELAATVRRLSQFETAMRAAQQGDEETRSSADKTFDVRDLTVSDATGRVLVSLDSLTLAAGETMLLIGPSGVGKTTLLRALAGIWPHTAGRVARSNGLIMGLPQRPYIPLGSLRRAFCYPSMSLKFSDERLREIMNVVGLSRLESSLDAVDVWDRRLSEGEKQRISLARVLLAEPDLILLDEPTSAIEASAAAALYQELRQRLPRSTIVSSAHEDNTGALHDRIVQVQRMA